MSRVPRRGDVFWVNLDPVIGTEIRKTRPAVVVSNDSCNRYGARVVVLPITSNIDSLYPGEAMIEVKGRQGRALGDQIRSIDKRRLKARVSSLTADEMARIDEALAITLGLPSRDVAEIAFAARISR
jgi:mRNA interferase MazF